MYICIHVDCVAWVQYLSVCTFVCMLVCMHVNLYVTTIVTLHCVETHIHVCHVLPALSVCMIIYTFICALARMSVKSFACMCAYILHWSKLGIHKKDNTCGHIVYMHRHAWYCLHACVFVAWDQCQVYVQMIPPLPSSWLTHCEQPLFLHQPCLIHIHQVLQEVFKEEWN